MFVDHVKLLESPQRVTAVLTVRDGDPITVDLGRVGASVSKKKLVDRAIKRTPDAQPGAFMGYSWEPATP